jgi:hypothetical protein
MCVLAICSAAVAIILLEKRLTSLPHAIKQFNSALHRRRPSSRPSQQLAMGDIAPVQDLPIIPAVRRILGSMHLHDHVRGVGVK